MGHISGRRVEQTLHGGFAEFELLQTDASINPGNSGGLGFVAISPASSSCRKSAAYSSGASPRARRLPRSGLKPGDRKARIGSEEFLVGGDVILEGHGISFIDPDARPRLGELLESLPSGTPLSVIVLRGGRKLELQWTPPKR